MREQNEIFDIKFLRGFVRRRKKVFLSVSFIIFVLSLLISVLVPNVISTATILIEGQSTEEFIKSMSTGSIEERLQAINQQILSRDKLIEIIKQFNLASNLESQANIESAVDNMRKNIIIKTFRAEDLDRRAPRGRQGTVAFSLSFQGGDPAIVQQVASRLAALYIEKNIQTREQLTAQTTAVLQARANQIKEQTELSGKKLNDFKRQHAGELPESVPINLEQLFRLNTQLGEINAKIKLLEDRIGSDGQISSVSSTNPSGNQAVSDPWARLAQLRAQLESLQAKYSEKHPDVIKTKNEIQRLETRLGTLGNERSKTSDSELNRYMQQKNEIERKIAELQRRNQMAPLIQSEHSKLSLEYDNAMKQHNDTMSKLAEAKLMKGIAETQVGERFTIIEEPSMPQSPEKPKQNKIILAGALLSIFCGFFVSVLMENIDHSIKSPEQLHKLTNLPVLTVFPVLKTEDELRAENEKFHVMKLMHDVKKKISIIIGSRRGQSKT
jgi:succinoglycan biosynthesis transport protein ExoP